MRLSISLDCGYALGLLMTFCPAARRPPRQSARRAFQVCYYARWITNLDSLSNEKHYLDFQLSCRRIGPGSLHEQA